MLYLKVSISLLLGIIVSLLFGFVILPYLQKKNVSQNVSRLLNERHLLKNGTPTMGGLFFVLGTVCIILLFFYLGYMKFSFNIMNIIFVFFSYAILGFLDDYFKIKKKNNGGLSIISKFFWEVVITTIFFFFFILSGNNTTINLFDLEINLFCLYGIFILFYLVGFSNAVNITDGLDGLCAGLCAIAYFGYGLLAFNSYHIIGYEEIGIFCFVLSGSLLAFLFFNFYPAKVFMGDLGSLALGGTLASISIILKMEISLIFIGIIFIFEMISSLIQIVSIRYFNKKIFLKSPFHHHLEEKGFSELQIVKLFYLFQIIIVLIYLL